MATLHISEEKNILFIKLNRPEVHNAFNTDMIKELTDAFQSVSEKKDLRALILSGEGKSFSSGADLTWMKSMVDYNFEENLKDSEVLYDMFAAGFNCPVPVIGKLHGHVMGGALGLAGICDLAAAETNTKFCFSEVLLGLVPAVISPFVLHKMNRACANEYMLTAQIFGAVPAKECGLVQFVGTDEEVDGYVNGLIHQLRLSGPEALRETKNLLRKVGQNQQVVGKEIKAETTRVIAERRVSEEGQEGLKGFLEKRNPSWR